MHSDMFRHNAQLCFVAMHSYMFRHNAQWYVSSQCIVACFVTMHSDMFPRKAWWHVSSQCAVMCFLTMPSDMFRQNAQSCFVTMRSDMFRHKPPQTTAFFFFFLMKHFDHFCCDSLVIKTFRSLTHSCIKTHHNSVFCLYFRTFWPTLLFFWSFRKRFGL